MTPEWLRHLADLWHKDSAAAYWLGMSTDELDHVCRGVCPGEVDPASQLVAEIEQWRRGLA